MLLLMAWLFYSLLPSPSHSSPRSSRPSKSPSIRPTDAPATQTRVVYISYTSNYSSRNLHVDSDHSGVHQYSQLMMTDDSPFVEVLLPWAFNLLGDNIRRVYISANGALFRRPSQPCDPAAFCPINGKHSRYYEVIAGYLTDLDPMQSPLGSISSYQDSDDDRFTVSFHRIVYYGTSIENSFSISLFRDGRIQLAYDQIVRNSSYPREGHWISGLRSAPALASTYFTAHQLEQGKIDWHSAVDGIYPSPSDVISGNQFNLCPFAMSWCIEPKTFSLDARTNSEALLTLSSLMVSCSDELSFGVLLFDNRSGSTYHAPCIADGNVSYSCNISDALDALSEAVVVLSSPTVLEVLPTWQLLGELEYHRLPIDSMSISVQSGALLDAQAGCSSNILAGTCDSCSICRQQYACLNSSSCPGGSEFDRPNCRGACPSDAHYSSFDLDQSAADDGSSSQCCAMNSTSCAGKCFGNDVLSMNAAGALYCCSNSNAVDCAGVCDGQAVVDCNGDCNGRSGPDWRGDCCIWPSVVDCAGSCGGDAVVDCAGSCGGDAVVDFCGECEGSDFTASSGCLSNYSGFRIVVSPANNTAFYPLFDITEGQKGMSRGSMVAVINDTPYRLWVSLDPSTSSLAPDLLCSHQSVVLNRTQSVSINVNISVLKLFTGTSLGWTTKRLAFKYGRLEVPNESIDYFESFPVYPSSTGCVRLTTKQQCTTFPGCIFCVQFPSMRVLRALQLLGNASPPAAERRLFSDVVPESYANTEVEEKQLLGSCCDGWRDEDCLSSSSGPPLSHLLTRRISFAVWLTALTIAFVNLTDMS